MKDRDGRRRMMKIKEDVLRERVEYRKRDYGDEISYERER